jgi:dimethylsulfoniopropionate demethylase
VGRCHHVPIADGGGGTLDDPVLLKPAPDRFRLSIADSDLRLHA